MILGTPKKKHCEHAVHIVIDLGAGCGKRHVRGRVLTQFAPAVKYLQTPQTSDPPPDFTPTDLAMLKESRR